MSIRKFFFVLTIVVFFLNITYASVLKKKSESDNLKKDTKLTKLAQRQTTPNIYIDCNSCDLDFIKTNIKLVNYVNDTKSADVYILITQLQTGSGGREYTLEFIGQKRFKNKNDKLKCFTGQDYSADTIRIKLVKMLKIGLIKYIKETSLVDSIDITFTKKSQAEIKKDKWNSWIYKINFSSSINGESSYKGNFLNLSLSAKRVTEKSRIEISAGAFSFESEYVLSNNETVSSKTTVEVFNTNYIHGLNEHWSLGGFFKTFSSSYKNKKIAIRPAIGVEYNVFPYAESTKKQFRFQYKIGIEDVKYNEITIYDKNKETLLFQEISTALEIQQKWGNIDMSITGLNYFYDFSKYSIRINSSVSWRILKGLAININGRYSIIHDQIYLSKGELTPKEILMRVSALATSYDYRVAMGFQITFGSIYNNIVNPRFED